MMKRVFFLLFFLAILSGQSLLAAEEGASDGAGQEQSAGQGTAEGGAYASISGEKKPAGSCCKPESTICVSGICIACNCRTGAEL